MKGDRIIERTDMDVIDRVAKAIFLARYPDGEEFWPDHLAEIVNGPPFGLAGYRNMACAAILAYDAEKLE